MPERRPFGRSGLEISPLTLGGNVFGWSADEETSFAVLDAYVAGGGNVIDSANIYSWWAPGNHGGESEAILGRWLAGRDDRDDLVVVTKIGMAGGAQPKGLTRDLILRGAEASLARLGIDHIDLYYAHEDDPDTPIEETLGRLRRAGAAGRGGDDRRVQLPDGAARRGADRERADRAGAVRGPPAALQPPRPRPLRRRHARARAGTTTSAWRRTSAWRAAS